VHNEPLLILKPQGICLFFIFVSIILLLFACLLLKISGSAEIILFFVVPIFPPIIILLLWLNSNVYKIYNDRIELEYNFINKGQRFVKFTDIKELHCTEIFIVRPLGLGRINIFTSAYALGNKGILSLYSLKNPKKIYETIKTLIHENDK